MSTRFGICTDQNLPYETIVDRWQYFEELGFDSIWDCDHFNQPSNPTGPYFEGWTLLGALAAATSRIRVGILVSSNTFRHPALLAQQAVTLDHVSGGRLELGLGAGWFEPEHDRFGIEFLPAARRVDQFHEAVQVLDRLLRESEVTFEGSYYRLDGAWIRPHSVQRPRPPLTLGAHRSRMLRICAAYADGWNSFGTVDEIRQRNAILDEHCAAIGRDRAEIRRSLYVWAAQLTEHGLPDPWESGDAFAEVVGRYQEVGINEFVIDQPSPDRNRVVEKIASEVIPGLR